MDMKASQSASIVSIMIKIVVAHNAIKEECLYYNSHYSVRFHNNDRRINWLIGWGSLVTMNDKIIQYIFVDIILFNNEGRGSLSYMNVQWEMNKVN